MRDHAKQNCSADIISFLCASVLVSELNGGDRLRL